MASTVQVPPPRRQRRSFAGPIVMIIVGIGLLLANMGVLHWGTLSIWFARYWPGLIILWGVIKLVEYKQAQREGMQARGIGAGGVILLIALIIFGLSATQAMRVNWGAVRDNIDVDDENFTWFGHNYNYDDQMQQDFPAAANLHVNSERGAVNVNTSEDNQIHVVIHKRINADSQGDADKWNAGTKPQITTSDHTVTLNANTQGSGDHHVTTDLDISIPKNASVVIDARRGDASVMGRNGDLEISNQHGDVVASDINGKVKLNLEHSSTRVSQVSGDVSVDGGHVNDTSIEDVKGFVSLNGEFMEGVKLARIGKGLRFKSSRTDMEMGKLDGDLDLDSGDLRVSDLMGPLRLSTRSKDVRLIGLSGDVRLQDENGDVEIQVKKLGSVQVDNRKGDVQLFMPENTGFQVEARAHGGEISSDFSEVKVENRDDGGTATGTVRGGGPKVAVNLEHGGFELHRGSSFSEEIAPVPPTPKGPKAPKAPKISGDQNTPVEPTEN
jgi:DUF4097 and DUF4098 domain-containing protein YvlB